MNSIKSAPRYMIVVKAAHMPSSCWGRYVRVGVVELEPGFEGYPKMLSERAKGVKRVIQTWEKCHSGTSNRDAHSRAIREAEELIEHLQSNSTLAQ